MIKYTLRTSTSKSYSLSSNNKEYAFKVKVDDDILKFKLTDGNDVYRGTYLISDFLKLNDKYKLKISEMIDGKFLEDIDERVKKINFIFLDQNMENYLLFFHQLILKKKLLSMLIYF